MKLLRKIALLTAAVAATAALAAPASAAEWTYEGLPLEEDAAATFGGTLTFSREEPNIKITCGVEMKTTLHPGGEGTVGFFKAYFNTCSGNILGCTPASLLSAGGLPWSLDALSTTEVGLGGVELVSSFFQPCLIQKLVMEGEVVGFPDNPNAISSIEFNEESGSLQTNYPGFDMKVSGTLAAFFAPEGAYGIE